jgi:hypothetical protein
VGALLFRIIQHNHQMKKTLFFAAMLAFAVQSQAQTQSQAQAFIVANDNTNSKALGLNLLFGSYNNNIGIGAKYQHFVTNNVRLEGSFGYYFPSNGLYAWDINANAHYVFRLSPKFAVYPLAGFSFSNWGLKLGTLENTTVYTHTGSLGANFGGGVQYFLSENVFVNAEVRQQVLSGNYSQANLSLGIAARF